MTERDTCIVMVSHFARTVARDKMTGDRTGEIPRSINVTRKPGGTSAESLVVNH
jgi:hypothetical protein